MRSRRGGPLVAAGGAYAAVLAALLLAPLAYVVRAAVAPSEAMGIASEQWVAGAGAGRALDYVRAIYGEHLVTSLEVALATGVVALAVGAPAGLALAASPGRVARAVEALLTLPLALPGMVVAMGLLTAYPGRGGALGLVLAGHALYTLPYAARTVAGATRSCDLPSLLAAARTLGARPLDRARLVALPSLGRALSSAALIALAVSWGEFNATFLLATPARGTFPTALYLTATTNSFPVAATAVAVFLAGLLPLLGLGLLLGARAEQGA